MGMDGHVGCSFPAVFTERACTCTVANYLNEKSRQANSFGLWVSWLMRAESRNSGIKVKIRLNSRTK